ncbi:MAG: hypothetical protein ACKE51_07620 [Methylococcaceae bacterium]
MHDDYLIRKLWSLSEDDIKTLLVGGLRLEEENVRELLKEELVLLCSQELRAAAGSTIRGTFRGPHEFPYKQILIDVADKLKEGWTPLSWSKYHLDDEYSEQEIENDIVNLFEERSRKWWKSLSDEKKAEFTGDINATFSKAVEFGAKGSKKIFVTQQILESLFQNGVIFGLGKMAGTGLLGTIGVSAVGQFGWVILIHTVGWITGLKIAVFGIGGMGVLGGAVSFVGATAVSAALSIPGLLMFADGAAYRKTVPTMLMLLARNRIGNAVAL